MSILDFSILIFLILETLNVFILYFKPDFKYGNSMKSFKTFNKIDNNDSQIKNLMQYMIYWVAGTKVIFILIMLSVLFFTDTKTKSITTLALTLGINVFYIKMYPLIRKMDINGELDPKGYSKTLGITILIFVLIFGISLLFTLFQI